MDFPGVQWEMDLAEVRGSLKIQDEDIEIVEESGRGSAYVVNDYELFGAKTKYTSFQFLDFADQDEYSLCEVIAQYPDDADMESIRKK